MLAALLQDLPGFFDRDPQAEIALRVRHPNGLRWTVDDADTLTLSPDGLLETVLDLRQFTLAELADHLVDLGFEIPYRNVDFTPLRASVLIPGAGDQNRAGGDQLPAFSAILWAHLKALGAELATAQMAQTAMLRQLILPQAREFWADRWGWHFGLPRLPGETDADYTQRIIDEVFRARNNPIAMVRNVQRYTGQTIELFEPWTHLWTLDQSTLSGGDDHLPSGDYWCYHTIQPVARRGGVNWQAVLSILRADKPAGTILMDPAYDLPTSQIDGGFAHYRIDFAEAPVRTSCLWLTNHGALDVNLVLSDYDVIRNWMVAILQLTTIHIEAYTRPLGWEDEWNGDTWQATRPLPFSPFHFRRTFCRGEIVLSDTDHEAALGELQGHLPGRYWLETGNPLSLSMDGPLSNYAYGGHWEPIDVWEEATWIGTVTNPQPMTISGLPFSIHASHLDFSAHIASARNDIQADSLAWARNRGWTGPWDNAAWDYQEPSITIVQAGQVPPPPAIMGFGVVSTLASFPTVMGLVEVPLPPPPPPPPAIMGFGIVSTLASSPAVMGLVEVLPPPPPPPAPDLVGTGIVRTLASSPHVMGLVEQS